MQDHPLLDVLTRAGVLINVSVRYWRGQKKLKPEDLGLAARDLSDRLISLGHKRLLPKEALAQLALVEGRAHALIEANTFPFLHGLGHFLPNGRLGEVTEKLQVLEHEFRQAQHHFLEGYASWREQAAREWQALAERLVSDPTRLVQAIAAAFPPVRHLERSFAFAVQVFQITLPEHLEVNAITLAQQREVIEARQRAVQEAAEKIRHDTQAFVADCVASLREQTAQLCEEMLHAINTSETGVHQKTLNRLLRFIDQFKHMNFANDTDMDAQLEAVRRELLTKTAQEYRDSARAKAHLVEGLSRLADKARELAQADTTHLVERFGELGRRKFMLAA